MSAPAVAVLSSLTEGMVDAALGQSVEGGMRAFDAALERYRSAGALNVFAFWCAEIRRSRADGSALDVLKRLDRDLVIGLAQ